MYTVAFGMLIGGNHLHRRVWDADRSQSRMQRCDCSADHTRRSNMSRRDRNAESSSQTPVTYRAARQHAPAYPRVSGGAPTRNAPSGANERCRWRAEGAATHAKHRAPVRLRWCATLRDSTRRLFRAIERSFCRLESCILPSLPAQHAVAADRFARKIVRFLTPLL